MRYIIKTSKTVEDAIKEALIELDVKEKDVEVKVLEEGSRGLFGFIGAKDAAVRVEVVRDDIGKAKEFLGKILKTMNIEANFELEKGDKSLSVNIVDLEPSNVGILIGKRGNTLNSIQYLLSLVINKDKEDYIRVIVDTEDYRAKREETLIRLATKMAEKSKSTNRLVKLEPMNPYERRIIHSTLQKYSGITTYSEGEEPYRRVVIRAK